MSNEGRLRIFRESLGLEIGDMASELGLEYQAYYQYEKGKRKIPQEVLQSLALKGLNLNWLATGEGEMKRTPSFQELFEATEPETAKDRHPGYTFTQTPIRGPTEKDLWLAQEVVENALRGRDLFDHVTEEERRYFAGNFARGLANGESLESLRNGLKVALDIVEKAYRKDHG